MHHLQQSYATTAPAIIVDGHPHNHAVLKSMLNREIQANIGYRSTISVEFHNGVVTLNGHFANRVDMNNALQKAIANPGVCKVVNNAN